MNQPRLPLHQDPPTSKRKLPLGLILLGLAVPIGLFAACSTLATDKPPAGTGTVSETSDSQTPDLSPEPSAPSETLPPPGENASASDLRIYYESLVAELNQALLDERTDQFLSDHEKQERIEELEDALADALKKLSAIEKETGGSIHQKPNQEAGTGAPSAPNENDKDPSGDVGANRPSDTETETSANIPSGGQPSDSPDDTPTSPYNYRIENGQAVITAYTGKGGNVLVPATLDGYTVVSIAEGAFQKTSVTSVTLPDTVTHIGWFAFQGCHGLETVVLPSSVTLIEYAAFDGCPSLNIHCVADSYAARYAAGFGIPYTVT